MKMDTIASPWRYDLARECALSSPMTFASKPARYAATDESTRLFRFKIFELDSTSRAQAAPSLLDTTQEPWVVLETVFEPVLFRFEADQHACGLAVPRDDDLLSLGFS
jgi:hypothetical protein